MLRRPLLNLISFQTHKIFTYLQNTNENIFKETKGCLFLYWKSIPPNLSSFKKFIKKYSIWTDLFNQSSLINAIILY